MSNYQPKKKYLSQLRHTSHDEDVVRSLQHGQYQHHMNMMAKQDNNMMMGSQVSYPLPPMNGMSNSPERVHGDPFKPQMCFSETRPPENANMVINDPNVLARMQTDYHLDMYMQNSPNFPMAHNMHGYDAKKSRQHMEKVESFMWPHGSSAGMPPDQSTYNQMFVHSGDPGMDVNNPNLSPLSPGMMGDSLPRNVNAISPSSRSLSASEEMSVLHIKEEAALLPPSDGDDDRTPRAMSDRMMSPQMTMGHRMQVPNLSPGLPKNFYHPEANNSSQFSDRESGCVSSSLSTSTVASQRPLLTSSGRNKGSGKPLEPKHACQVCGDVAAGFHCGAYVCEACKKFFLRCLKTGRGLMFLCPKNSNCDITKETRSHCQRCRYQRCIELSMYKPGREDDKKLKVDFRSIPCKVCKAPSSGFHFGAITCEGCKGFFRRMLKEQVHRKFVCSNDERCNIDSANRTTCKSCRFAKCLKIGMTLEGTRLGRQSNSVKRGVIIQCLPNRRHLLNERSLSVDAATSEASCHSPLHLNSEHPSTLRRLLSDAEASRHRDQQSVGSEDDDNAEGAGGANVPSYAGDDVFLRTSDSSGVASGSSNRCLPHYGDAECHHRMAYSNGSRAPGLYHDDVGSSQFVRRENSAVHDRDGMEMMNMHLMDGNKNVVVQNDYLPLKSEPMELNEADGLPKTDVNFNPLYASDRLGMTGGYDVGGGHPYFLDANAPMHSNHPPHLSMSLVMAEHARSQLGRELSHDAEVGTRSRLQVEGRRQLYEQPKHLFCDLVAAFKQLDDIWIRPAELEELMYCPATLNTIWKLVEIPFRHMVRIGVRFFRRVPGFNDLSYADKLRMCKDAIYPLWLVYHSSSFNMDTQDFNWFTATSKERDLILAYIRPLNSLVGHFRSVGFSMQSLNLNEVERSFLAAMTVLSSSDGSCLEFPDAVFTLQDELLDAFFNYQHEVLNSSKNVVDSDGESCNHLSRTSTRLAVMLARLAELKRANIEHCNVASQIIQSFPHMETGDLWKEIFLDEAPDSAASLVDVGADAHPTTS